MQKWQKEYVTQKKAELIERTLCNSLLYSKLIAENVLQQVDVEIIKQTGFKEGPMAEAERLYNYVETRVYGYEKLTKVLFEGNQSGAFKILLEGLEWEGVRNPFQACNIRPDLDKFLSKAVYLQGQQIPLQIICQNMDRSEIKNLLQTHLTPREYFEIFHHEINSTSLVLLNQTIPEKPTFYIPRSLTANIQLDSAVFRKNADDIFVFKNIQPSALSNLVRPAKTALSSKLPETNSVRFILLVVEDDWNDICNKFKVYPIHLIQCNCEERIYNLEKTTGQSEIIWSYLYRQKDFGPVSEKMQDNVVPNKNTSVSSYLSENELLDLVKDQRKFGVCICDSPGMGKTLLATSLAQATAKRYPNKIVGFIQLSTFLQKLPRPLPCLSEDINLSKKLIVQYLSSSSSLLMQALLSKYIQTENKFLELFFDGFDEVAPEDVEWTKTLLEIVANNKQNIRLFVTSRSHMRQELEKTLGVISYNILPFTEANQVNFLVDFWHSSLKHSDNLKLKNFAEHCIQQLKSTLTHEERDIAGIPLQCKILAEVNSKVAQKLSQPETNLSIEQVGAFASSMFLMYKTFIHQKFFSALDSTPPIQSMDNTQSLKNFHVLKALEEIFPEISSFYTLLSKTEITDVNCKHYRFGILELVQGVRNQFVHRSIAEYFVAEFFAESLSGCNFNLNLDFEFVTSFLVEKLFTKTCFTTMSRMPDHFVSCRPLEFHLVMPKYQLYSFTYSVIIYFLNGMLKEYLDNSFYMIPCLTKVFCKIVGPANLYSFLQACTFNNYLYLLSLLQNIISQCNTKFVNRYAQYLSQNDRVRNLLYTLSSYTSSEYFEAFEALFSQSFGINVNDLYLNLPETEVSPLHISIREGNYFLVETLLNKVPNDNWLENRSLISFCTVDTKNDSDDMVEQKLEILKLLLSRNNNLFSELQYGTDPILSRGGVHSKIVMWLVEQGKDILGTDAGNRNLLHYAAFLMPPKQLNQLVRFLLKPPVNPKHQQVFLDKDNSKFTFLHLLFDNRKILELPTAQMILSIPGFDINWVNSYQENLLFSLIKNENCLPLILLLVKGGIDYNQRCTNKKSVLHKAVEFTNIQAVKYFSDLVPTLKTECNKMGDTPIQLALRLLEKAEEGRSTTLDKFKLREIVAILK